MKNVTSNIDAADMYARRTVRGFPSAGERLIRKGLISPDDYERSLMAETESWNSVLAMDEAALDAELGSEEVAAINTLARRHDRRRGNRHVPHTPNLTLVANDVHACDPPPYVEHFRLRLAGVRDGLVAGREEIARELRSVRRLLMASQDGYLTDVFCNLQSDLDDGRLLVVERIEHGIATLEACLAYELVPLTCAGGMTDWLVRQRVTVIRLLAVRESDDQARLAARLCSEAQLRSTVRAMHDGGPHSYGMLGIMPEVNTREVGWTGSLGDRVQMIPASASAATNDRTLEALRDVLGDAVGLRVPSRFVIANRTQLFEAAQRHLVGIVDHAEREDEAGRRFDYDTDDPWSQQIAETAKDIFEREPDAWRRLGLLGKANATLWGPPPTHQMSISVVPPDDAIHGTSFAGVAA